MDLDTRGASVAEIEQLATEINAEFTAETSAKTGEGVEDLFVQIAQLMATKGVISTKPQQPEANLEKRKKCCR
jgi:selenocysteine-specific translation elongation factor